MLRSTQAESEDDESDDEPDEPDEPEQQDNEEENQVEDAPDVIPDDQTEASPERPTRSRTEPSRLTYESFNQQNQSINQPNQRESQKMDDDEWQQKETCHNIMVDETTSHEKFEYSLELASVIAQIITDINGNVKRRGMKFVSQFSQQYALKKGLKEFGQEGIDGAMKELEQLHKRTCFTPVDVSKLTRKERRRAMRAIMLLQCTGPQVNPGRRVEVVNIAPTDRNRDMCYMYREVIEHVLGQP